MNKLYAPVSEELVNAENDIAALLSIIPGLGHIYKGHYGAGFGWMLLGMPLAFWVGILLGLATAGVGLLFPLACWAGLVFDAYNKKDRRQRRHHILPPMLQEASNDDELPD
jgi:TM2 domain-containing membrane protein YozV